MEDWSELQLVPQSYVVENALEELVKDGMHKTCKALEIRRKFRY